MWSTQGGNGVLMKIQQYFAYFKPTVWIPTWPATAVRPVWPAAAPVWPAAAPAWPAGAPAWPAVAPAWPAAPPPLPAAAPPLPAAEVRPATRPFPAPARKLAGMATLGWHGLLIIIS